MHLTDLVSLAPTARHYRVLRRIGEKGATRKQLLAWRRMPRQGLASVIWELRVKGWVASTEARFSRVTLMAPRVKYVLTERGEAALAVGKALGDKQRPTGRHLAILQHLGTEPPGSDDGWTSTNLGRYLGISRGAAYQRLLVLRARGWAFGKCFVQPYWELAWALTEPGRKLLSACTALLALGPAPEPADGRKQLLPEERPLEECELDEMEGEEAS